MSICVPFLSRVLAELAPGTAVRVQHSDSAMGHLLELQAAFWNRADAAGAGFLSI